jgi:F0F1-type ATP synthase gamma subunit
VEITPPIPLDITDKMDNIPRNSLLRTYANFIVLEVKIASEKLKSSLTSQMAVNTLLPFLLV